MLFPSNTTQTRGHLAIQYMYIICKIQNHRHIQIIIFIARVKPFVHVHWLCLFLLSTGPRDSQRNDRQSLSPSKIVPKKAKNSSQKMKNSSQKSEK